jgi:hypothetical protein
MLIYRVAGKHRVFAELCNCLIPLSPASAHGSPLHLTRRGAYVFIMCDIMTETRDNLSRQVIRAFVANNPSSVVRCLRGPAKTFYLHAVYSVQVI